MTWSLVNHAIAHGTNTITTTGVDTTGANLLLMAVYYINAAGGGTFTSVSDSKSNTWTQVATRLFFTSALTVTLYYASNKPVSVGTSHTFTLTGTSLFGRIMIQGWSFASPSPLDLNVTGFDDAATNSTFQTGSITPKLGDLIVAAVGIDGAGGLVVDSATIGSSFTISDGSNDVGSTNLFGGFAYLVPTSTSAVNPLWSAFNGGSAQASSWGGINATFFPFTSVSWEQDLKGSFPQRQRAQHYKLAAVSKGDEQWPFTATPNPLKMQGIYYDPQFPVRTRQDPRQARGDEQWPFTAVPTPAQVGWEWRPEFARSRFRPQRMADEQWPFTAVSTPAQFGWDNPERFSQRIRFRPSRSADEQWPFTAVATPGPLGWQFQDPFPQRRRPQPGPQTAEVYAVAQVAPFVTGWNWDPLFPTRQHFRPSQSADEEWPFTAVLTPGPLGWQVQDPFPLRRRFQPGVLLAEVFSPAQATQTPTGLEWAWDPQFPSRLRFRTFQASDEQWPFTAALTPGQFGWDNPERFPARRRFRIFQQADEQWPFTAISTPAQFGWQLDPQFAVRRRFRTFQSADEQWAFTSVPTPAAFGFSWDPTFPFRIRYRPLTLTDEQWSFTATPTPTQFGWHLEPQVPLRARFRPQLAQFDVTTFTPGTLTPTNIDFAYPPEFLPIRARFRPLIHETFHPQPPIISPTFQTMQAGATKVKLNTGATFVTINLKGTGAFVFSPVATPTILNEALPFGSAQVVLTSGTTPVSVALAASNDGVNFVQVGPAATNFPMIINLTALPLLSIVPYAYHAWIVTGGDATTQLTITEIFTGWRG